MKYEIVKLEEKVIEGISAKTENSDSESGSVISGLWKNFFEEKIFEKIEDKKTDYPICLYSDYENKDENGKELKYEFTIGYEVENFNGKGFSKKIIPAGNYAKFLVRGNVQTDVIKAWSEIWEMDLDRSYTGDFEVYLNESMDDGEIEIYVALK